MRPDKLSRREAASRNTHPPPVVVCGAVLAIATARFWGWFEARTGIESLGHSGPAGWVYIFCWALCAAAGFAIVKPWRQVE